MISFDKVWDVMTIDCDKCPHFEELDGTFDECIAIAKSHGWYMKKIEPDSWEHYCDSCKKNL